MSAVDPSGRAIVIPGGGSSLPAAAGANEVPASTGAGTAYSAVTVPALLATVSNTRGRLLRRGASAWEALDAQTLGSVLVGDGTDVASSPLATLALPQAGSTFTASNGVGTATNSTLTLSVPGSTVATAYADRPRLTKAHGQRPFRVDVVGRLASQSGGDANSYYALRVTGATTNTQYMMQVQAGTGAVTCYRTISGADTLLASGSAVSFTGSEWFRIVVDGARIQFYQGTGSAGSQTWTLTHDSVQASFVTSSADLTSVELYLYQGVGAAGTVTVTWADVALYPLL